jgi:hypothetical protein
VWLDRVETVLIETSKQLAIISHQPDHEFALRFHRRVDGGLLQIGGFAVFALEYKIDLGMRFRGRIQFACAGGELVSFRITVAES